MLNSDFVSRLMRLGLKVFQYQDWLEFCERAEVRLALTVARVVVEHGAESVLSDAEQLYRGVLAGRLMEAGLRPCVGDFVVVERDAQSLGPGRIVHVLARSNVFRRRGVDGSSSPQEIAANVDMAVVVSSLADDEGDPHALRHGLSARRIERYVAAIREANAQPLVLLNKADLRADAPELASQLQRKLGVQVCLGSARSGDGEAELRALLTPNSTTVLVGSSGVGKSSWLNRLSGEQRQRVHAVRESDTRGRHTTTARELFVLPNGALLIDTPGMREFGVFSDEPGASIEGFDDVSDFARGCRFGDCHHQGEPGCAVAEAVDRGVLAADRVDSFHRLQRELSFQQARHDVHRRRAERKLHKVLAQSVRESQRRKGRL